ncbi:Two-component response regulator SSK1p [Cryptotrichosporon argae]
MYRGPSGLSVDTAAAPPGQRSPAPQSAIIDVPPGWSSPSSASGPSSARTSVDQGSSSSVSASAEPSSQVVELEPPLSLPLSASSSSSSLGANFRWPARRSLRSAGAGASAYEMSMHADDPLARSSSSSSGDGDEDALVRAALARAPASPVAQSFSQAHPHIHPRHLRSTTDPLAYDPHAFPVPIDAELAPPNHAAAAAFPFEDAPAHPTLNRTFSSPLPNRVGSLRHPLSPTADRLASYAAHPPTASALAGLARPVSTSSSATLAPLTPLQTFQHELADTLQSAIQTLLHLSPPHLLDNAKEQYSGCTVQMPTTSLSALLTSMRGLNYLSANVVALCDGMSDKGDVGILADTRPSEDFDIGELLQSVADLLSGQAAQAGVDLVLFHGDVGMKHVSVTGDRDGIAYALGHVIRQILLVANKGDTIELGLQIVAQSPSMTPRVSLPLTPADTDAQRSTSSCAVRRSSSPGRTLPLQAVSDGPLLCIFEIVHNVYHAPDSNTVTPKAELNPFTRLAEQHEAATPKLDTLLCRRLLQHVNASLKVNAQPSSPLGIGLPRHGYELSVLVPRGQPIVEPVALTAEEVAVRQPFASVELAREPTLAELATFAESLRGKKVHLHAGLGSVFARHLTSYLAAWGLDVSHIPIDDDEALPAPRETPRVASLNLAMPVDKFVVIDDDVHVLRQELIRLKSEPPVRQRSLKRPTAAGRTRSSPLLRQMPVRIMPIIIHFTSLAKYNQVRDVVTSLLGAGWATGGGTAGHPEVMVIPKPVGPRRFLTALHTAVNQPLVDPFFSPIATSPRSPGPGAPPGRTPTGNELGRDGFFDPVESPERRIETKPRSPLGEFPPSTASIVRSNAGLHLSLPTPGEIVATPASEYFSSVRTTTSGASGVVMQSPDGRPFGMFFEPPKNGEGRRVSSSRIPSDSIRRNARRASASMDDFSTEAATSTTTSPQSSRRVSGTEDDTPHRGAAAAASERSSPASASRASRRRTLPTPGAEPIIAHGRDRSSTLASAARRATPAGSPAMPSPVALDPLDVAPPFHQPRNTKKAELVTIEDVQRIPPTHAPGRAVKGDKDVVVPPINVLIVEDNPINQNILSMFFRKKKIKHQTAKDGLEAVEKWRTGGFHLILMDIQLPVMDGIEATKEIRKLEKSNNIGILPSTPVSESMKPFAALETPAEGPGAALASAASFGGAAAVANGQAPSPFRLAVIIVALTASSLQTDRVAALAAGCNDFLTKPVSLKWLEKKTIEWGCMQALIDFDGWRRWKGADPRDETKKGFQLGPQLAAKSLAGRLRIAPSAKRAAAPPVAAAAAAAAPTSPSSASAVSTPDDLAASPTRPAIAVRSATPPAPPSVDAPPEPDAGRHVTKDRPAPHSPVQSSPLAAITEAPEHSPALTVRGLPDERAV